MQSRATDRRSAESRAPEQAGEAPRLAAIDAVNDDTVNDAPINRQLANDDPAKDSELTRARKLRGTWVAPGPKPRGDMGEPDLRPSEDETLSFLTGDFRLFQKKRGHRWSLDDAMTALVAIETAHTIDIFATPPTNLLDLGTGIGSVLHMLAWALPEAHVTGIEAQEVSYRMARRSVRYNGLTNRVHLTLGDLRSDLARPNEPISDAATMTVEPTMFDLITGTPPYLPLTDGVISKRVQKGPCCFEFRGGVEDYCIAAAPRLLPHGRFVVCEGYVAKGRTERGAAACGLAIERRVDVIPKAGKSPLFQVFVLRHAQPDERPLEPSVSDFVVRDSTGAYTPDNARMRQVLGMPPLV
jgi:tRNA1Val (adenine37-N6)-methyltransferase